MKSTNNLENIRGLARQATLKYKHDHIIVKTKTGYNYIISNGKTTGIETISYKELSKANKKPVKKVVKESKSPDNKVEKID